MEEKTLKARSGMFMLILSILLYLAAIGLIVLGGFFWTGGFLSAHGL